MAEIIDQEAFEWLDNNKLSYDIWDKKYRHNNESFEEWLYRITPNPIIRERIRAKEFIFGGRILASRGIDDKKATYSNCFVIEPPEDNLQSIFDCGYKMAKTYSMGGGCGTDVSKLRPKGAKVNNAASTTSGATSFMDFYSYITGLIGQEGRRGALMLTMDCNHPDIEDFINLKTDLNVCTKANISVRVTNEFMHKALLGADHDLDFTVGSTGETIKKKVNAKKLLYLLAKRNWEMAEPGILYWDKIINYRIDPEVGIPVSTNPCRQYCKA